MEALPRTTNPILRLLLGLVLLPWYLIMLVFVGVPFLLAMMFAEAMIRRTKHGNVSFYPTDRFAWVPVLESNWRLIRAELDQVLDHLRELPNIQDISPQGNLTRDDKWKSYLFNVAGEMDQRAARECPDTVRLLSQIPDLYFAQFSILTGGKHIPAHCGHYNGVVNCHLALLVPDPPSSCRLRVTDEYRSWEEGKVLAFDDRKEHEAWNDSPNIRAVLIIHVVRPLPKPLDGLNRLLLKLTQRYHPVVRLVRKQNQEWFEKFDRRRAA